MNVLSKSVSIVLVVIFIGGCLSTSFANTIQADYSPCLLKKCVCSGDREINSNQLSLNSKVYPHGIHSYCILYQASNTKEIIPIWIDLEEEDILSLVSDISKEQGSFPVETNSNLQVNIAVPKLPPAFLLESSFRL